MNEPTASPITTLEQRTWQTWFRSVFQFDLRSLATFRILVGLTLISDLIFRASRFGEMYTESGIVPIELSKSAFRILCGEEVASNVWSIYWANSETAYQAALFGLAMIFAMMLTTGLFTRLATLGSWILLVSLHARNPLVLTSGDFILKMSLFWSIFLPLGARWSLDAKRLTRTFTTDSLASFATAGFMLQVIFMYFFTGLAKLNGDWFSGNAMYYVLRLDIYITEFGRGLLSHDGLLKFTCWATLFAEVLLIWTMLLSWKNGFFRMLNLIVYWSFHIGIGLCMDIGLFPIICMVIWLPLIPTWVWDRKSTAEETNPRKKLDQPILLNVLCGTLIGFILLWNVFNIQSRTTNAIAHRIGWATAVKIGYFFHIDQHFQMFGHPPKESPWFVYEAKLRDGSSIDLFRQAPVTHERPESVRLSIPGHHWRKYHRNLVHPRYAKLRQSLVDYMVKKWNREHGEDQQVDELKVFCYLEATGPNYNSQNRRSLVWGIYENPDRKVTNIFDELDKLGDGPLF